MPKTSTSSSSKRKPHGTGKKKIEIKKIESESSRKVTFSKRRKGLFKKADELCRLSDAEIAIIVFSPKGRLYSFGHPSADAVVNRFLGEDEDGSVCVTRELEETGRLWGFWWEESVEGLDVEELEKYKAALQALRGNVATRLDEMVMRRTCERNFLGSELNEAN